MPAAAGFGAKDQRGPEQPGAHCGLRIMPRSMKLKALVEVHLERLGPVLDLEVIPKARIANQPASGVNQSAINGK
jgi:hypothetical protein